MSGQNRLVKSMLQSAGEAALAKGLLNANEVAARKEGEKGGKKGKKVKK